MNSDIYPTYIVKICKCSHIITPCWYHEHIGKIIRVVESNGSWLLWSENIKYDKQEIRPIFCKQDCEILDNVTDNQIKIQELMYKMGY